MGAGKATVKFNPLWNKIFDVTHLRRNPYGPPNKYCSAGKILAAFAFFRRSTVPSQTIQEAKSPMDGFLSQLKPLAAMGHFADVD